MTSCWNNWYSCGCPGKHLVLEGWMEHVWAFWYRALCYKWNLSPVGVFCVHHMQHSSGLLNRAYMGFLICYHAQIRHWLHRQFTLHTQTLSPLTSSRPRHCCMTCECIWINFVVFASLHESLTSCTWLYTTSRTLCASTSKDSKHRRNNQPDLRGLWHGGEQNWHDPSGMATAKDKILCNLGVQHLGWYKSSEKIPLILPQACLSQKADTTEHCKTQFSLSIWLWSCSKPVFLHAADLRI